MRRSRNIALCLIIAGLAAGGTLIVGCGGMEMAGVSYKKYDSSPSIQARQSTASTKEMRRHALAGPSTGGNVPVNGKAYDAEFFKNYGVNPFIDTEDDNLSTFAVDVDTASYAIAQRYLFEGHRPEPDSVRVEEFVNAFDYGYTPPRRNDFSIHVQGAPSRFGGGRHQLLRIGLKAREVAEADRKSAALTLIIDVSGSMDGAAGDPRSRRTRLDLIKASVAILVDNLRPSDRVGIVAYSDTAWVVLEPTFAQESHAILAAMDHLTANRSTNAEAGLGLGYRMAEEQFRQGGINRVIFCSDGLANMGATGADSIFRRIERGVKRGITMTAVGVGTGNYNDVLLEQLGDRGNGHYAYINTIEQAEQLFGRHLVSTLQVVARDVKVQVEFDKKMVERYRLLGYENRAVKDKRFRNDKTDGGEVGPGHSVTALYEIKFFKNAPAKGTVATVRVRYKDADTGAVKEGQHPILRKHFTGSFARTSSSFRLAAGVAEFSEILRNSYWAKGSKIQDVLAVLEPVAKEMNGNRKVGELLRLVRAAEHLRANGDR